MEGVFSLTSYFTGRDVEPLGEQERAAPAGHPLRQVGGGENWQEFQSMHGLWLLLPHFLSTFPSPPPALCIASSKTRQEDNLSETI